MRTLFVLLSLFVAFYSHAIDSAQSGLWSAPSTWVGGIVPTDTDNVTILSGHTVTVDASSGAQLLTIQQGATLTFSNAVTAGLGTRRIHVEGHLLHNANGLGTHQMTFGSNASFTMSGNARLSFTTWTGSPVTGTWLDMTPLDNANVNITGGTFEFNQAHTDPNQLMMKAKGDLVLGVNNLIKFTNPYATLANPITINAELPIVGNLETPQSPVQLSGGMVNGQLTPVQVRGNFTNRGYVLPWSTTTECIFYGNINSIGSSTGIAFATLRFGSPTLPATNAQTITATNIGMYSVTNLYINNTNAAGVLFTGNFTSTWMNVSGTLTFNQGKLFLGSTIRGLTLTNPVVGASANSYIVTQGTASVFKSLTISTFEYPVGSTTGYAPIVLSFSSNSNINTSVQVIDDAMLGTNALNRKWRINKETSGFGTYSVTFKWLQSYENSAFDRTDCYGHHISSNANLTSGQNASGGPLYAVGASFQLSTFTPTDFTVKSTPLVSPIVSAQSGPWEQATTWVGGTVPSAASPATILSGHTVTVQSTANARNLLVSGGASLVLNQPSELIINNGALTVDGSVTLNGGATWTAASVITVHGNVAINSTGTLNLAGQLDNCCFPVRYSATIIARGISIGGATNVAAGTPVFNIMSGAQLSSNQGQITVYRHKGDPANNTATFLSEVPMPTGVEVFFTTPHFNTTLPIIAQCTQYDKILLNIYQDYVHFGSPTNQVIFAGNFTTQSASNGLLVQPNHEVILLGNIQHFSTFGLGLNSTLRFGSSTYTPAAAQEINNLTVGNLATVYVDNPHGIEGNLNTQNIIFVRGKIKGSVSANTVSGYDNSRYVVGSLALKSVAAQTNALFPVGTQNDYLPIIMNSPTGPSDMEAGVSLSNTFVPTPSPGLTLEFLLRKSSTSPFGIPTATVSWTAPYEKPGFTRNGIRLYYFYTTGGGFPSWQTFGTDIGATGTNPYQATFLLNAPNSGERFTFGNGTVPLTSVKSVLYLPNVTSLPQLTTNDISLIAGPQKGMIVYDINTNCMKYYNGTLWKCVAVQP
jgi:hypothetical protein